MPSQRAPRVTGLGGVFFKARDTDGLCAWYREHLDLPLEAWGGWAFKWRDADAKRPAGVTIWSPFKSDSDYFAPSESAFMFNFRVDDLDRVRAGLKAEGVWVDDRVEESEFGRFGWALDPEGNKIELWEPPEVTKWKQRSAAPKRTASTSRKVVKKVVKRATKKAAKREAASRQTRKRAAR